MRAVVPHSLQMVEGMVVVVEVVPQIIEYLEDKVVLLDY